MPAGDLLRALPAGLLVTVLPGLAVATLVRPDWRWWWRLAAAPGLSAGLAGLVGLVYAALHVRFAAVTVLPILFAVVAAAVAVGVRGRGQPRGTLRAERLVVAAALAAGVLTATAIAVGYRGVALPTETDAPVHGAVIRAIADQGTAIPVIAEPVNGSGWARTRIGFEAESALVVELGGPSAAGVMLPLVTLAAVLLPLGLAALVLAASGSAALAALAALVGVGMAFPIEGVIYGEYPAVVDATLVAPLVLAGLDALEGRARRRAVTMVACVVAAIWVVHGLEALTAAVVGVPFLASRLRRDRLGDQARGAVGALAGAGAAALTITLLTRAPSIAAPRPSAAVDGPVSSDLSRFAAGLGRYDLTTAVAYTRDVGFSSSLLALAALAGVVVAVRRRQLRWCAVASTGVALALLDLISTHRLGGLWTRLFPWSSTDRVLGMLWWTAAPLIALALAAAWDLVRQVSGSLSSARGGGEVRGDVVRRRRGPALAALALAGGLAAGVGGLASVSRYQGAITASAAGSPADVRLLADLDRLLGRGRVVLTDGSADAGQWVDAFSPNRAFLTKPFLEDHPHDGRLSALAAACSDPGGVPAALAGVDAVYVGAQGRVDAQTRWDPSCLRRLDCLRQLAIAYDGDGQAVLLAVVPDRVARCSLGPE